MVSEFNEPLWNPIPWKPARSSKEVLMRARRRWEELPRPEFGEEQLLLELLLLDDEPVNVEPNTGASFAESTL